MAQEISKYQIYREPINGSKIAGNYLDRNKLLTMNQESARPYSDLTYLVRQSGNEGYLSGLRRLSSRTTPLLNWFEGTDNTEFVDDRHVRWRLEGDGRYMPSLMRNLTDSDAPGLQGNSFQIKLDYGGFRRGDKIAPDKNKRHQLIIERPVQKSGGGMIYEVKYITADPNGYFPPKYLKEGSYWVHMGNSFGEATKDEGGVIFSRKGSYVEFQIGLNKSRWKLDVTDEADLTRIGAAPMYKDKAGKMHADYGKAWDISAAEVEFMNDIEWQKELWTYYGSGDMGNFIDPSSSYERHIGPGLLSFLEDGNVRKYSPETDSIRRIVDILQRIWFDRVAPGQREVMLMGGERFLTIFDEWVREEYNESATVQQTDFVLKRAKSFSDDQDGYGFPANQFTEYYIRPFGKIVVGHLPILDSTILTSTKYKGYPISSYEAIAFDIGIGNSRNSSNIKLLKRRNTDSYYYSAGRFTPYGYRGTGNAKADAMPYHSDHGDYYTLHYGCEWAVWMGDITRSLWLKPNIS